MAVQDDRKVTTVTSIGAEERADGASDEGVFTARPDLDDDYYDEHADPDNFGIGAMAPTQHRTYQTGCEPGRANLSQRLQRQETLQTGGDPSLVVPEIATRR